MLSSYCAQPLRHRYGARFDPGMGYRNDHTRGLAVGQEPESMCAVLEPNGSGI